MLEALCRFSLREGERTWCVYNETYLHILPEEHVYHPTCEFERVGQDSGERTMAQLTDKYSRKACTNTYWDGYSVVLSARKGRDFALVLHVIRNTRNGGRTPCAHWLGS